MLNRLDLSVPIVSCHRVSHAVCDRIDERHQGILPDYVWGDGDPVGVQQRAAEEVMGAAAPPNGWRVGVGWIHWVADLATSAAIRRRDKSKWPTPTASSPANGGRF